MTELSYNNPDKSKMTNSDKNEEQLDAFTLDKINRIGGNPADDLWQGLASHYSVIFESLQEKHPDGVTYSQFAAIYLSGRYEKVLPPHKHATNFPHYSLGYGKHQIIMRLVFVAPGSPIPSARLIDDELPADPDGLDPFVEMFYPQSALKVFLDSFENAKQILFKVRPYAPQKSLISFFGQLEDPFNDADPFENFSPGLGKAEDGESEEDAEPIA